MTPTTKYMELLKAAEDLVYSSRSAARTYHRWGREDAVKELRQIEELAASVVEAIASGRAEKLRDLYFEVTQVSVTYSRNRYADPRVSSSLLYMRNLLAEYAKSSTPSPRPVNFSSSAEAALSTPYAWATEVSNF